MGGGSYDYIRSAQRSTDYQRQSREQIFKQSSMSPELNIKGKDRESRDSDEHPISFPVIIALDETGSMGVIPEELVKGGLSSIMKKLFDNGIEHIQICFMGVGDHRSDRCPIQVGQFETSDDLQDHWLSKIYLEGNGGGNGGESYQLAWYYASRHIHTDSFEKRNKKGILITIGDEPVHKSLDRHDISELFGDKSEKDILTTSEILDDVRQQWKVYHINLNDYSGCRPSTKSGWKEMLGDNFLNTETAGPEEIPELIQGIIIRELNGEEVKDSSQEEPSSQETKKHQL